LILLIVVQARKELIAKALLKALSQFPKQDYRILSHMLPEKLVVSCMRTLISLSATHFQGICLVCFHYFLFFGINCHFSPQGAGCQGAAQGTVADA
jgi:hypothetical protein